MGKNNAAASVVQQKIQNKADAALVIEREIPLDSLNPTAGRIIVDPVPPSETAGRMGVIHIPERHRQPMNVGYVIACGKPRSDLGQEAVPVGALAVYFHYAGESMTIGGHEIRMMELNDICCWIPAEVLATADPD